MLNIISKKKILMPTLGYKLTVDELSNALTKMKNNKSPGTDGILGSNKIFHQKCH